MFNLNLVTIDVSSGFSEIISANIKTSNHNRWTVVEYKCDFIKRRQDTEVF